MNSRSLRFLSRQDILKLGGDDMALAEKAVKKAFDSWSRKDVIQPAKTTLKYTDVHEKYGGLVNVLPAALRDTDGTVYGLKALGAMPTNVEHGLPRATGIVALFDGVTKTPLAVMDAQVISAMRTGAVTALAARKLCRSDATRAGLVGAGVNMRTQLLGLKHAIPGLSQVKVYSRGASKHDFIEKMGRRFPDMTFEAVMSAEEAVREADIVVTCVANSDAPIVTRSAVNRVGVTIFNIGCLENEPELLQDMDLIISDHWKFSKHRGIQTHAVAYSRGIIEDEDVVDLSDILSSKAQGRTNDAQKIFFCPTGLGVEDIALARELFTRAKDLDIGQLYELWDEGSWI